MIIEIKEDKFEKMAEYTEKMLKYGGKLMSCLSSVGEEYGMSFRDGGMNYREHEEYGRYGKHSGGMNERYPYMGGSHIMYRDHDEDEYEMGERRRRRSNGRYY